MFGPALLWAFARECPRVRRGTRLDDLARRMVPVSVLVGCLLWVGFVTWLVLARAGRVPPAGVRHRGGRQWNLFRAADAIDAAAQLRGGQKNTPHISGTAH